MERLSRGSGGCRGEWGAVEILNIIWYNHEINKVEVLQGRSYEKNWKCMYFCVSGGQNVIVGSVFLIMGLVLLLVGIIFVICWRYLARYSGEAAGVIIDITRSGAQYNIRAEKEAAVSQGDHKLQVQFNTNTGVYGNHSNMYAPVFQYIVDGRTYSRASGLSYNKGIAQKKLGKTVPVYYNVNNPQKASLSNGKGYKMLGLGLSIGGILFCIIGFALTIADHIYLI